MRFSRLGPLLALVVAAGALAFFLLRRQELTEGPLQVGPLERGRLPADPGLRASGDPSPKGGVYDGLVVDVDGRPIEGAHVLLVRYETGEGLEMPQFKADGSDFDVRLLPRIGAFEVSGETRSKSDGRFQVAAGAARDRVKLVVAWTDTHAPAYVFTGKPGDEVRVVLHAGGFLLGTVVDGLGQPVAGAVVQVFLQQIAPKAFQPEPGKPGRAVQAERQALAAAPTLGDFLGRILGPRVYGLDPGKSESFRMATRPDGTFRFGPVDDSVQLEVVITHPGFMWTDFDEDDQGYVRRPVLAAGETLRRTYTLREGNWIEGRVVSEADPTQGVEGVLIRIRHPVAYKKHHFYEYKTRDTITGSDGSFRLSGLSHAPYVADLYHPSFGTHFVGEIPANTKNLVWAVPSLGALEGTLPGLEARPPGGRVDVVLEPVGAQGTGPRRHTAQISDQKVFLLEQVPPGRYRVSVRAGNTATAAQEVEVVSRQVAHVTFESFRGGSVSASVQDTSGRAIDPATVTLLRVAGEGESATELGSFVSRAGRMEETAISPGRYRLEAAAAGYLPGRSDVFVVEDSRETRVPPVVLRRPATLRLASIKADRGQTPQGDVRVEIREGEDAWRGVVFGHGAVTVRPGTVEVRATDESGATWSQTLELAEGQTQSVEIVLTPP
jgi:hypothetical protein